MDIRTLISVASTVAKVGHGLCKMDSEIEMEKYKNPIKKVVNHKEYKQAKARYDKYHK